MDSEGFEPSVFCVQGRRLSSLATSPSITLSRGSGGRVRTSNLLLNRELPYLLGYTGSLAPEETLGRSRPKESNLTSPCGRQGYGLVDIPVSRSGWYSR